MIRINKNLFIFAGLIFLLGTSSLVFLQRFLPLVSHVSYYCQSFVNSLSLPIPYYLGIIPFLLFSLFLFIASIKLLTVYIKVQLSKKKLIRHYRSNTAFNVLLEKLQVKDKTYLIKSEKQFAFCLGIRHPKIYVSTSLVDLLTIQELEAVLRHERYHLNNRDTLTMLIASIGESLLPFFPLFSDFLYNYRIEREIRADAEAIQGLSDREPLISALKKLLIMPSMTVATASAIADHDTLEPRIRALVKQDFHFRKFKVKHIVISVLSIFVMSLIALAPVQAVEIHHMGEDVTMICPSDIECINACKRQYATPRENHSEDLLYSPMK